MKQYQVGMLGSSYFSSGVSQSLGATATSTNTSGTADYVKDILKMGADTAIAYFNSKAKNSTDPVEREYYAMQAAQAQKEKNNEILIPLLIGAGVIGAVIILKGKKRRK